MNLIALLIKLCKICCTRFSSASTRISSSILLTNSTFFFPINGLESVITTSTTTFISIGLICNSKFLCLSLEKSRMSFTKLDSRRPLKTIIERFSTALSGSGPAAPSINESAIPIIPLIGVRNSWEVLERKSSFNLSNTLRSLIYLNILLTIFVILCLSSFNSLLVSTSIEWSSCPSAIILTLLTIL